MPLKCGLSLSFRVIVIFSQNKTCANKKNAKGISNRFSILLEKLLMPRIFKIMLYTASAKNAQINPKNNR
jgi:hypothetical protein